MKIDKSLAAVFIVLIGVAIFTIGATITIVRGNDACERSGGVTVGQGVCVDSRVVIEP